jgi:signal transduction histidine kinase
MFLAFTFLLGGALAWLGWRLLEQEAILERQRGQERLEHYADLVASGLQQRLARAREQLALLLPMPDGDLDLAAARAGEELAADALIAVFQSDRVTAFPPARLLYQPWIEGTTEAASSAFESIEASEFGSSRDLSSAIDEYRELASSGDPAIRAGALLRMARCQRRADRPDAALDTYAELSRLDTTPIATPTGPLPAGLLARYARCDLLATLNRRTQLIDEARALNLGLREGRWPLGRPAFLFYRAQAAQWLDSAPGSLAQLDGSMQSALGLTDGAEALWQQWQLIQAGDEQTAGLQTVWLHGRSILLLWHSTRDRLIGLVVGPDCLSERWLTPLPGPIERREIRLALLDRDDRPALGELGDLDASKVLRTRGETRLPWTVQTSGLAGMEVGGRRHLFLVGVGFLAVVVLICGYFIVRAGTRELEIARLQSDFVSAVSHEFRTPLASLRQMSEMLIDGRVSSAERRQTYFESMRRESERLQRLVEGLLDFKRMEAGVREYQLELVEPEALMRSVTDEFAQEVANSGYRLELQCSQPLPRIRVDTEAVERAVWNLLDNAVKYSPDCKTVWIDVARQGDDVAICVEDRGIGIPPGEEQAIFERFVRATSSRDAGARGTGLGLTMVREIVSAHGGRVLVESRPGEGSRFTIVLPQAKEVA